MAFKRATWHSGLTYRQTCDGCKSTFDYTDYNLDFRPWYADGFVYCPKCKKPIRHNETYAINNTFATQNESQPQQPLEQTNISFETSVFCSKCGNKFGEEDVFCSKCGNKR